MPGQSLPNIAILRRFAAKKGHFDAFWCGQSGNTKNDHQQSHRPEGHARFGRAKRQDRLAPQGERQ
jgi:hypothetical protein